MDVAVDRGRRDGEGETEPGAAERAPWKMREGKLRQLRDEGGGVARDGFREAFTTLVNALAAGEAPVPAPKHDELEHAQAHEAHVTATMVAQRVDDGRWSADTAGLSGGEDLDCAW